MQRRPDAHRHLVLLHACLPAAACALELQAQVQPCLLLARGLQCRDDACRQLLLLLLLFACLVDGEGSAGVGLAERQHVLPHRTALQAVGGELAQLVVCY